MNENPIQNIQNELARVLGEDPANLKQVTPQWLNRMRQGVIVEVHVGRWRGRSKLEYRDLGLPEPTRQDSATVLGELLTLGRKNLLPTWYIHRFDAIDASARKVVGENGAETYWGIFVSAERYQDKVKSELLGFQAEYFSVLDEMIENFERVKMDLADEYRHQARLAFERLSKINPGLLQDQTETGFVETFVSNILVLIPSPETIRNSYYFDWELKFVPLPDLLSDQVEYSPAVQMEFEQLNHERKMNQIVEGAERSKQNRAAQAEAQMRAEILAKAQAEKEAQVTTFMKDLVTQLRTLVYEASTDILATLNKNEKLHPRSVVQIQNLVTAVGQMNFFGDADIDHMVDRIRQEMGKYQGSSNKDVGSIRETLEAVAVLTRETLINLGETPRTKRGAEVVEVPTLADTRKARQVLDFEAIQAPSEPVKRQARLLE